MWLPHLPPALPRKGGAAPLQGGSVVQEFQVETISKWAGAFGGGEESGATLRAKLKWHMWGQSLLFKDAEEGALWRGRSLQGYCLRNDRSR